MFPSAETDKRKQLARTEVLHVLLSRNIKGGRQILTQHLVFSFTPQQMHFRRLSASIRGIASNAEKKKEKKKSHLKRPSRPILNISLIQGLQNLKMVTLIRVSENGLYLAAGDT